jgi:twitching motility protein PilT
MSTPNGASTIERLIDMFAPEDQSQVRATLAGALKLVISQRLVPVRDGSRLVAAAELITGNVPLWTLIRDNKLYQLPSLLQRGRAYGMIRAEDSLNDLLEHGVIDEETARAHADEPKNIGGANKQGAPAPVQNPATAPGMMGMFRKKS